MDESRAVASIEQQPVDKVSQKLQGLFADKKGPFIYNLLLPVKKRMDPGALALSAAKDSKEKNAVALPLKDDRKQTS